MPDINELSRRKSPRTPKPTAKVFDSTDRSVQTMFGLVTIMLHDKPKAFITRLASYAENVSSLIDNTINNIPHFCLNTDASSNDTFTLTEMLKQDDISEFVKAMVKEVCDHEDREHWEMFLRSKIPQGCKTILAVWSFKRKRYPDGRVLKHKARLCAHGGMQQWGIDFWETYAPVVNWISVRLLLILATLYGLETKSIDFVLAFPQADLDTDVFMELPYGFQYGYKGQYVLKLKKNLYGLKSAAVTWFNFMCKGLEAEGFVQSEIDQCVILLVYVDDVIAISNDVAVMDLLVKNLQKKYTLEDEGSLTKYLGVDMQINNNGTMELKQPFLIERILKLICSEGENFESKTNIRPTPAVKPLLHKDLDGPDRKCDWNYRQAIGMMTYLQNTTRPDISMAVHQCARFSIDPKLSHERAVKRIGRYLLGTQSKGLLFKPNLKKGVVCYVDADFAGG